VAAPVRVGIIGCGAISQVHHLPNLSMLRDEFEITAVCDISDSLVRQIAAEYNVPFHFTDYRDLLACDLDATMLCASDPKTAFGVASFEAGKHTFIEKPICFTVEDADRLIEANRASAKVGQVGYMKVFDPAFELVEREVEAMKDGIRYIQVNHLHTNNSHHLSHFRIIRGDPPASTTAAATPPTAVKKSGAAIALGDIPPEVERVYGILSGSLIHDLYGLRHLFGDPLRVVSTEIWNEGYGVTTVFEYDNGARCVVTLVELPHIRAFKETLEISGDDRRISLSYPSGFARGILSQVKIEGVDAQGRPFVQEPSIEWESAFVRELRHFHSCIVDGVACRTPLTEARRDVALIGDICRRYLESN
jgi:predicted dehydrogenase